MLIPKRPSRPVRRGVTVVELGVVAVLLFMVLFGIFEYCRFLFVLHVTNNAARDAVRFAVVHTGGGTMPGEPATISQSDITSIVTTGQYGGTPVGAGMCGLENSLQGYSVSVFTVDPAGLAQSPPVVRPLSGSQWDSAAFTEFIAVQVTGSYRPVLPSLLWMNASVPITVTVMGNSEGN